jgi:signal transduction histidine kinase
MDQSVEERCPVKFLISSREQVSPTMRVESVADRFFAEQDIEALALAEEGRPCGLATRGKVMSILFNRFGFELFGRDPILEIADREPLMVGEDESLEIVLDKAMRREFKDIYDEILVVDEAGRFKGLLSVKRLVVEQGNALTQSMVQKEVALTKAREMKKVTDMKSRFIAHVTHELRSPVNAIIGLSELMQMAVEGGQSQHLPEKLSLLSSSAVNLRTLITNILDLSKIEAGRMDIIVEEFDLIALLQEVAETTRILLGEKPVVLEVAAGPEPQRIHSDRVKVRQILTNLSSNAAKFTDKGRIAVSLKRQENGFELAVSDTGSGIRKGDLGRLFTSFTQLEDSKTRRHEGTGLGLAITKELVSLLEGRITVASTYGEGTTFTVHLPLKPTANKKEAA